MRCIASRPMMNQKRIWGIAKQLERKADEMGIWSVMSFPNYRAKVGGEKHDIPIYQCL